MESTPLSLLERVRQRPCDQTAWKQFVDLYAPLLRACVRQQGFSGVDLDDLVAESLIRLFVALTGFVHGAKHSFRSWLVTIVRNRCRTHRKKRPMSSLSDGVEPVVPDTVEEWIEREWLPSLARRVLRLIKQDFESNICQACKSRVLARLRQELDGLLE